jgi:3D (Asp-Asp-Asp) domain-containing protein
MSKYAVLLLPFFIGSLITVEPLVSLSSTDSALVNSGLNAVNNGFQNQSVELLAKNCPRTTIVSEYVPGEKEPKVMKVLITAYSSSPEETDNTPLITASGNYVRPGVVAANFLAFGTRVRMPKIFGDKIFVVEDRLHERYNDRIDVWFSTKEGALRFGQQITEIEIL